MSAEIFAATAVTLYVAHHVGDYWVQTDHQARHKGDAGWAGRLHCLAHVASYLATQAFMLTVMVFVLRVEINGMGWALLVSGVTHYLADRREHGLMLKVARLLPGKAQFIRLGVPRAGRDDNPSLGTGAWALDQSWHILLGVWVPALIIAAAK